MEVTAEQLQNKYIKNFFKDIINNSYYMLNKFFKNDLRYGILFYFLFFSLVSIPSCSKYYDDDGFTEDLFRRPTLWQRQQGEKSQVFVNNKGVLELNINEKIIIGASYMFPFYKAGNIFNVLITARARGQAGRFMLFDNTTSEVIYNSIIDISENFREYRFEFKMPEKLRHTIWLKFMQKNCNEIGGSLYIKYLKIYYK